LHKSSNLKKPEKKKMKILKTLGLVLLLLGVVGGAGEASAAPVAIANPSFESPAQAAPGDYEFPNITGWNTQGFNGVAYNESSVYYSSIPDGNQFAFSFSQSSFAFPQLYSITQILPTDILASTTYTLQVYVGTPLATSSAGYIIGLADGATGGINVLNAENPLLASTTGASPSAGTWVEETVTYTSPSSGSPIGDPLMIVLSEPGNSGGLSANLQTDFDAVTLDAAPATSSAVPEPAGLLLYGAGLVVLTVYRKRLQKA
jgi:hypothetical protein